MFSWANKPVKDILSFKQSCFEPMTNDTFYQSPTSEHRRKTTHIRHKQNYKKQHSRTGLVKAKD